MKLIAGQRLKLSGENEFIKLIRGKLEVYAVTRTKKSFLQIFLWNCLNGRRLSLPLTNLST